MWLYVPTTSSPSAPAPSTPSLSESSWQFRALASSVTLSETHSAAGSWYRRWKRDAWLQRLCSRMCEPSTAEDSVDSWIASQLVFRANHSPALASDSEATIHDTCSRTSSGSQLSLRPKSSGSRTSPDSSQLPLFCTNPKSSLTLPNSLRLRGLRETRGTVGALTLTERGYTGVYSENAASPHCCMSSASWKEQVTERRGACSRRRKSARRTSGSVCSSWPTATEGDSTNTRNATAGRNGPPGHAGVTLVDAITTWPTPRAADSESCGNHPEATDSLTGATRLWTTPNVPNRGKESKESTRGSKTGVDLQTQADMWQTPRAGENEETPETYQARRMRMTPADRPGETGTLSLQVGSWPTPKGRDHKGQSQRGEHGLGDALANMAENTCQSSRLDPQTGTHGSESSKQTRRLNPRFVTFLMGWPLIVGIGSERWETAWSVWRQRMRTELSRLNSGMEADAA